MKVSFNILVVLELEVDRHLGWDSRLWVWLGNRGQVGENLWVDAARSRSFEERALYELAIVGASTVSLEAGEFAILRAGHGEIVGTCSVRAAGFPV